GNFKPVYVSPSSFVLTAGFIIVFTAGSCGNGKCSATHRFAIGDNMVDGYALLGHVFENVSVGRSDTLLSYMSTKTVDASHSTF
ncbi:hypothetical protein OS493_030852, partial [Desmophyllum pertusum]